MKIAKKDNDLRVVIIDRRLCIGFHNGLTFINQRGLNNSVGLTDKQIDYINQPNINNGNPNNNQEVEKILEFNGSHEIDHIFIHDYGALIF